MTTMSDDDKFIVRWFFIILAIMLLIIFFLILFGEKTTEAKYMYNFDNEHLGGFMYMNALCKGRLVPVEGDKHGVLFSEIKEVELYEYPDISEEDREVLYRIVEAEATGGTIEQKKNVASCVLARMESKAWPNDIWHVVFQKDQFTPIWDGRYYTVKIKDSTREAVDWVLKYGKTHDCLWFCSDGSYRKENSYHRLNRTWVFYDGEHHYFYD